MSAGKSRMIILAIGGPLLIAALFFMVWSIVPLGGNTLPHLIEERSELSFRLSAMLVSLGAGFSGVAGVFVFSFLPLTFSDD